MKPSAYFSRLSDTTILLGIIGLFILASLTLFSLSRQALEPNQNKKWWSASFSHPTNTSVDFTIVNHTPTTDFSYSIESENTITHPIEITIPSGATRVITPVTPDSLQTSAHVIIRHGDETRDIFKR